MAGRVDPVLKTVVAKGELFCQTWRVDGSRLAVGLLDWGAQRRFEAPTHSPSTRSPGTVRTLRFN